jgi:ketosteroid isomerase-like protein
LPAAGEPVVGREVIARHLATRGGFALDWEPREAVVAHSGDLGYTWGTYETHLTVPVGPPQISRGKYANVWRKAADGHWRVALDIGNASPGS